MDHDLVVIGAGIHGAGVAQAAAASGYRVLVLEQYEKAAQGTSSRSSKLIHGGLRYLETGQLGLVYECLRERAQLLRNAPHLVELVPFYIPDSQPEQGEEQITVSTVKPPAVIWTSMNSGTPPPFAVRSTAVASTLVTVPMVSSTETPKLNPRIELVPCRIQIVCSIGSPAANRCPPWAALP